VPEPSRVRTPHPGSRSASEATDQSRPTRRTARPAISARGAHGQGAAHQVATLPVPVTVQAGVTVLLAVTHGAPRAAFTVMDTGRKRTGGTHRPSQGEANATHLAAALPGPHLYRNAPTPRGAAGRRSRATISS
jgi:hypothetical protein